MLQNLEFWLKMRALQQKVCKIQGFLVKNLEISKVFTPPTGYATAPRLLLRFYVTIFGIFKQNWTKKSFFQSKFFKSARFLQPQPDRAQLQGFYRVFMLQYLAFSSKISQKKTFFQSKFFKFARFIQPQPEMAQLQGFYCVFK